MWHANAFGHLFKKSYQKISFCVAECTTNCYYIHMYVKDLHRKKYVCCSINFEPFYFEFLNHVCLLHIVYTFTSDDSCGSYSEIQPHLKIGIIKCISTLSKYNRAISKFKKSAILHSMNSNMKDHPNSSKTFILGHNYLLLEGRFS